MEPADTLTVIFKHNQWANLTLLSFCAQLEPELLSASTTGTLGTIQETLEHIAKAERSYVTRISTGERYRWTEDAAPMTLAEITDSMRESGEALLSWADKVAPEDTVEVDWDGEPRSVPKTIILAQLVNHGGEHREQVKAIFTHLGVEPPDLDAWEYFDQMDR